MLPEYLPQAVDILADILRPSLREEDFDTEKKVILEEIEMYEDQPGSVAWDHARRIYYDDAPARQQRARHEGERRRADPRPDARVLHAPLRGQQHRRLRRGQLRLGPSSCGSSTEACSGWNTDEVGREQPHRVDAGRGGLHVLTREKVQQEYVMFMAGGPPADSKLRYAADTLALAVGDDTGSRLYWALVDPGHADSADCSYVRERRQRGGVRLAQLRAGEDRGEPRASSARC